MLVLWTFVWIILCLAIYFFLYKTKLYTAWIIIATLYFYRWRFLNCRPTPELLIYRWPYLIWALEEIRGWKPDRSRCQLLKPETRVGEECRSGPDRFCSESTCRHRLPCLAQPHTPSIYTAIQIHRLRTCDGRRMSSRGWRWLGLDWGSLVNSR